MPREIVEELQLSAREVPGALRRATEEAQQLGIFGAPTFTVEGELFWGNDRLEQAVAFETRG